jgi:hypothetical protein
MKNLLLLIALLAHCQHVAAFLLVGVPTNGDLSSASKISTIFPQPTTTAFSRALILGAGFGGGDSKSNKKESKIKPKQQWDRYCGDLKKEKPYRVAVKVQSKENEEWLEVGNVKSKDSEYTKAAVARQRALIAEVRRVLGFLRGCQIDMLHCFSVRMINGLSLLLVSMHIGCSHCKYPPRIRSSGHIGIWKTKIGLSLIRLSWRKMLYQMP